MKQFNFKQSWLILLVPLAIVYFWRTSTSPDLDEQVINALIEAGSDVSKPHAVDFFLDFSGLEDATLACNELLSTGYEIEVSDLSEDQDPFFYCQATDLVIPSLENIREIGYQMDELAESHNGNYDGWRAPIVKSVE